MKRSRGNVVFLANKYNLFLIDINIIKLQLKTTAVLDFSWSLRVLSTEYIFYCKRAILFLSSSKILTPHPPLRPASVYPCLCCGGRADSPGGGEGDGGSIFWKTREIGSPSYSKICTLWSCRTDIHFINILVT